jgi:hypothetical protein
MAETVHSFNEYIEEGSKLQQFKEMYDSLEQMGKAFKDIKGTVDNVKDLNFLTTIKDKFQAETTLNEKINNALKNLGLSNNTIALLDKATKGLISSVDPFIMSLYGSAETFISSILEDVVSNITSKIYIPEDVFLLAIKGLAAARSDPNHRNVLRSACLTHDLAKTLEWLDNYNGTKYDIDSNKAYDAVVASRNGSFHVATYILNKLKKTYLEVKATPVITEADENRKALILRQYEIFYNTVIKNIFVYSYDNLTVDEFRSIIKQFPTFTPACLGTNDEKYSKRASITYNDINILAPIKYYRTLLELGNNYEQKAFIVPRNHNIKKLYVWLAFSPEYNDSERLIHEALHNRLKYKMLSTLEESFYEAQKALLDSPLGQFISNTKEDHISLIAKYVKEVEQYLFDPRKQDLITGEDHVTLPNFKPQTPSSSNTTQQKRKELTLPKPSSFTQSGVLYSDFEVYLVDSEKSIDSVVQDSLMIVRKRRLPYMTTYIIDSRSPDPNDFTIYQNLYLIFHNEKYNGTLSTTDKDTIINYIIAKYIIDYYQEQEYPYETICAMFPSLNSSGVFYQFIDYYEISNEEDSNNEDKNGLDRELNDIPFYNQVITNNGNIIKIEETGINSYNIFGEKIKSIYNISGTPVGISIIGDDTYLLVLNKNTGELEIYYSPDNGITLIRMNVDAGNANIYPGVGVTSLHQINFFKSMYYNDILFIVNNNRITYSENKIDFNELNISFPEETILGISFLPNNDLYILTNAYVYMIDDFDITLNEFHLIKLESNNKFTIIDGVVGTIITAVSIPLNTTDDFDIDDMNIITKLLMYYNSTKLAYYWYSAHSEIASEMFDANIARLQTLLNEATNEHRIKTIQRCIERQEYFKSKLL